MANVGASQKYNFATNFQQNVQIFHAKGGGEAQVPNRPLRDIFLRSS